MPPNLPRNTGERRSRQKAGREEIFDKRYCSLIRNVGGAGNIIGALNLIIDRTSLSVVRLTGPVCGERGREELKKGGAESDLYSRTKRFSLPRVQGLTDVKESCAPLTLRFRDKGASARGSGLLQYSAGQKRTGKQERR